MRLILASIVVGLSTNVVEADPWVRHTIDDSSRGADGVRIADVNRDGRMDIVTGWEEGGVIRLCVNPGPEKSKQHWPAVTVGQVRSPEDAVLVDLDGDGAMDVVSSCEGRNRTMFVHWAPSDVAAYLAPAAWRTEPIDWTQQQQAWMFALPMQVDGRYNIDLVIGSKGDGATIGWIESPADPRDTSAWRFHTLYQAGWIMSLVAHDMDSDGDQDILASDRKGRNRGVLWLENPGSAAAAAGAHWTEHRIGASDREVMFLTVAKLGTNARPSIVCAVSRGEICHWTTTGGSSKSWNLREIPMPPNCGTGKGVAVGDLDLDGEDDVVFSCENASGGKSGVRWLSWEASRGDVVWADHEISGPEGVKFDRLELLDLDGDGDLDVVTCEERDNLGVIWYENPRH